MDLVKIHEITTAEQSDVWKLNQLQIYIEGRFDSVGTYGQEPLAEVSFLLAYLIIRLHSLERSES
jgi:hypothetical protein